MAKNVEEVIVIMLLNHDLPSMFVLTIFLIVVLAGWGCVGGTGATPLPVRISPSAPKYERLRAAKELLMESPLIDG